MIPDIKTYQNKEVSAILLFAPEKYDEILKNELPKEMNYLRFDDHGVDVGYYQNTKGEAIKRVLDYLKIDKGCSIGIGDSLDDVSMFHEVGLSIAMGNGQEEAKKEATIVAPTIADHGIKEVFEKMKIVKNTL